MRVAERAVSVPPGPDVREGDEPPVVLACVDWYLPGYRAGGPLRTLANTVERLGDDFRFRVLTRDRDLGDAAPYPGVPADAPVRVGKAEVRYLPPEQLSLAGLARAIRTASPRVLYLNSLFSPAFTLRPLLLRRLGVPGRSPVVVAPRGELSPGALALKGGKKTAFLRLARAAGLYRGVLWQASSAEEAAEIRRWFGAGADVFVAPDLPAPPPPFPPRPRKRPGELRVAFLSRISRKKNLDGALRLLEGLEGEVRLDVYGPPEDAAYLAECRALAARLPPSVRVEFHGPVPPEQVPARLAAAHVFLLPTRGENFGHVVLEALLAGCVPVISDRTPWRGLAEQGAGWDLSLEDGEGFRRALQRCIFMSEAELGGHARAARAVGEAYARGDALVEMSRTLFAAAACRARHR
jgi:glycosyltransferase involved in cell wall biosynthesis